VEFIVIVIGIVIVVAFLFFAVVLGGIGVVRRGPKPHEGDQNTG
jgi:hypothetical protein